MKALRSKNGGELIFGEFKDFCSAEGIRKELIAPHNPQQNGVAERKNRTIVGAAWAMLHDQGLPYTYGLRHAILQFMCKIVVLIGYLA